MKITFGMIVFNSDFVLKQCLEQVYPFASQILISEGPVKYWQEQGFTTSTDDTNNILVNFPDPDNKIKIIHGQFSEKDEQCKAYMQYVNDDTDYIWNLDSDEVYKTEDIKKIIEFLQRDTPTSVGVQSCSFYGGFDNFLTGFELNTDNFLRIFKYEKGCTWQTHRPPTIKYTSNMITKHISSKELFDKTGAQMYHYSYVFPKQVYNKVNYYKSAVSRENCINDYFLKVYLPWVIGKNVTKLAIEQQFNGVHEFKPEIRGECYTSPFTGEHPASIKKDFKNLKIIFNKQLKQVIKKRSAWYNNDVLPQEMINAAEGKTWGFTLEKAPHFNILKENISICKDSKTMLDIGCGAGEVGRIFSQYEYTGCDLDHIIKNVAKVKNSNLNYFTFDAYESSFDFCNNYDIILCNGFLSELEYSVGILEKILKYAKRYVIIHRQIFLNTEQTEIYTTYGNLKTIQNMIDSSIFNSLVKNKFKPLCNILLPGSKNERSVVMEKIT